MNVPEVIEIDLTTGSAVTHPIDTTSWLDRVLAYWMPVADAKGPSLGTYSSGALSSDGSSSLVATNKRSRQKPTEVSPREASTWASRLSTPSPGMSSIHQNSQCNSSERHLVAFLE